jgi:short-subunit dehydrogenase
LHAELRPQGVKVTAVEAGDKRTSFAQDRLSSCATKKRQDLLQVAQVVRFVLQQTAGVG